MFFVSCLIINLKNHLIESTRKKRIGGTRRKKKSPWSKRSATSPCLKFFWKDKVQSGDNHFDKTIHDMTDIICPVFLDVVVKGDPRIDTVNIIWVNPDTNSWIGKSNEQETGELAVEVVVEREAVSKSGDPWRIVLDCCLPVFHLIDTTRLIPYSVKQIQEALGISCAFDQAVQRLSTSVEKVAKGVLKEHLILLGSSMTSTGNLIGFNNGGIKAMYSTSGVKAPFTEATQYTPRKCFEKAAEKCQLDSLSSVVASCCWGKPVVVGTSAKFDVLWKEKDTPADVESIDVYEFLHLVRKPQDEDGATNVDEFQMEDEDTMECQSPKDSRVVFEDDDYLGMVTTDGWGNPTSNPRSTNLARNSRSQEESFNVWDSNPRTPIAWKSDWGSQSAVKEPKRKNLASNPRPSYGASIEVWGSKKSNPKKNKGEETRHWGGSQSWGSGNEEFTPLEVVDERCSGWNVRTLASCDASRTNHGNGRGSHSPWKQNRGSPWKKKNQHFGRGCSSEVGQWRNKPSRPPMHSGQRNMDAYTPQESNIRSEIDPIMKSVKRIMQQEGCIDGVPISKEDQAYIVNNVLAYHPDRDAKARGGIDYIMVSLHSSFQGSRCFYVVSRDGEKQDFSYKKCLENKVKSKYPIHADSFISKYWRKPQSGGRR